MNSRELRQTLTLLAGASQVALYRIAIAAGMCRRPDGWRRAAGLVLRGDNAKFVLSAFGLHVWSDVPPRECPSEEATRQHLAHRLHEFLEREPALKVRIRTDATEHCALASSSPSYTLAFEAPEQGTGRFVPPQDWRDNAVSHSPPGDSTDVLMNIICRVDASGHADLWVRVNHVGADGVPVQTMLSRLEAEWRTEEVVFPTASDFAALATPRPWPGRPDLCMLQSFVDFSHLVSWRKAENARLPEPMTFSAALLWRLAQHRLLDGRYMGTTVEVPATNGIASGVGVVVTRPADYLGRPHGLARYVRDFNKQMDQIRRRESPSCKTLDAAALLAPRAAERLLRHGLDQGTRAFGSLGLTILKDARVFGAPIGDTGHDDGFIAVGSISLPTKNGQRVGCVTVKGPSSTIREYPGILSDLSGSGHQSIR